LSNGGDWQTRGLLWLWELKGEQTAPMPFFAFDPISRPTKWSKHTASDGP